MPVRIPTTLPAAKILTEENIFVIDDTRASKQDIRPLKIAILNLMPTKEVTETQLLRLIGNTPIQLEITLLRMASHEAANTSKEYLASFYRTFESVKETKYDGLIITGAPVENLAFEEVDYWPELTHILDWSKTHVFSTLHICWGAQAGLYYHYGIGKHPLPEKAFGVFNHTINNPKHKLLRGFDDTFLAPHSRHTTIHKEDILKVSSLEILAESDEAGVFLVASRDGRSAFVSGHAEYDAETLSKEYKRDIDRGLTVELPKNYFPDNDPTRIPPLLWRAHANLLFVNWLNYFVYQETPYDIENIH